MVDGFLKEEGKEFKQQYKAQVWWVEHRNLTKKIGYGIFMAVDAVLILFALWTFVDGFLISSGREQAALARLILSGQDDLRAYTQATAALPLETGNVTVLSSDGGGWDLHATVTNPNMDWYAEFEYAFMLGDASVGSGSGFVLPDEEKPLISLAVSSTTPLLGAELVLENIRWQRVDKHLTGVYESWSTDRLNLVMQNVQFATDIKLDTKTIGRVTFTVTNKTAFSYYDPSFVLLLKRGGAVVGINRTTLASLDSGESRDVEVNWFGPLPAVSSVDVIPDINIFDVSLYKPLPGEATDDTRTRVFSR